MLKESPSNLPHDSLFDITEQLLQTHPLLILANAFDWRALEEEFKPLYKKLGRKAKPIRLMCGLLILDAAVFLRGRSKFCVSLNSKFLIRYPICLQNGLQIVTMLASNFGLALSTF